jgi:hypothetical protein
MMKGGLAGEFGTEEKVCPNVWGGVLGVGGESTMTIRSFLWVLVGFKAGISLFLSEPRRRSTFPFTSSREEVDTEED